MPDNQDISDQELIRRTVAENDQTAFEQLVKRHYTRAYQVAYSVLNNIEDAEEVTQDAFYRVSRALPNFRGDAKFTTWLHLIVINLARNKFRWNKIRGIGSNFSLDAPLENAKGDGEMTVDVADEKLPPDQQLAFDELKNDTRKAMSELPPAYREAVILRNIKNLTYEEIAELLDCKVGTVKSRIARGRELLRESLHLDD